MRKGRQIMAIDKVREYLKQWNADGRIREFQVSSATVELAAQALNCEGSRIAKTLSFETADAVSYTHLPVLSRVPSPWLFSCFYMEKVRIRWEPWEGCFVLSR